MLAMQKKTNENVLNALIGSFKIDINQRNAKGRTALTQAEKAGNRDIVDCLLEIRLIDVNALDQDSITV
jgi:ankyrin repeat protein